MRQYDFGVPLKQDYELSEFLLFYNSHSSLPNTFKRFQNNDQEDIIPFVKDIEFATKECDLLNIASIKGGPNECLAIMSGQDSYHYHQFRRPKTKEDEKPAPLSVLSRNFQFTPPIDKQVKKHQKILQKYFESIDENLNILKTLAEKVANENNEIIVLTSNFGQSALLMNFVCHSKAHLMDISNIILFPTDRETFELGNSLGLATFFDEKVSSTQKTYCFIISINILYYFSHF